MRDDPEITVGLTSKYFTIYGIYLKLVPYNPWIKWNAMV